MKTPRFTDLREISPGKYGHHCLEHAPQRIPSTRLLRDAEYCWSEEDQTSHDLLLRNAHLILLDDLLLCCKFSALQTGLIERLLKFITDECIFRWVSPQAMQEIEQSEGQLLGKDHRLSASPVAYHLLEIKHQIKARSCAANTTPQENRKNNYGLTSIM
ncbi:unnamed protein product [Calicophoron daubneyi]|uniref:Uncharacterized protein n=1 Tax=Calicophoron daubneyi TaxID=300641 RepID=A0AAV2TL35_CALDB